MTETTKGMNMRELTDHVVNPESDRLRVVVVDEPGAGGAHHRYEISGFDVTPPGAGGVKGFTDDKLIIVFQNGTIPEAGVNGVTHEALLAVVMDRLECFQAGPYACEENGKALIGLRHALEQLQLRTLRRVKRGVEGTHTV